MLRSVLLSSIALGAIVLAACSSEEAVPPDGSSSGASVSSSGSSGSSSSGASGSTSGSSGTSSGTIYSTEQKEGIATYYDATGAGAWNCGFGVKDGSRDVTALNFPEYAESAACGGCITVNGPKGSVTVRVVDSCPGCEKGHLDLSEEAFAKIADKKDGRVPITYQGTACDVSGNLSYEYKDGSSKYWTAIQVRNHRLPITKVEYKKGDDFVDMPRTDYNYFIEQKGVGDQPSGLTIRITAADGQTVEDTIPGGVTSGKVSAGSVQFK